MHLNKESDLDPNAYKDCPDRHFITFENIQWFCDQYLEKPEEKENPYASPLKAADLKNLPPALIITAEWDPLHVEGLEYANLLQSHGNNVVHQCYPGVIHGFLGFPMYPEKVKQAMSQIHEFIH